jgi:5-methyltetrahydropteroyltriglutamate--homocysteine methyltransferase
VQLASERNPERVLRMIRQLLRPDQRVFVGVTDPLAPEVETPDLVRDRVFRAAHHLPVSQLGTTDDCGFAPFADDVSTSRDVAFAKIRARVEGTAMAADELTRSTRTHRGGSSL